MKCSMQLLLVFTKTSVIQFFNIYGFMHKGVYGPTFVASLATHTTILS